MRENFKLTLSGTDIEPSDQILDLGVKFSIHQSFHCHLEYASMKANRVINMVKHNLRVRSTEVLRIIYQMYFQPRITYASQLWFNLDDLVITKVNELDRQFWKLAGTIRRPDVLTTVQLMVVQQLMLFFDYKHGGVCLDLEDDFQECQNMISTRRMRNEELNLPKPRIESKREEFVYTTTRLYNMLSVDQRNEQKRSIFKRSAIALAREKF